MASQPSRFPPLATFLLTGFAMWLAARTWPGPDWLSLPGAWRPVALVPVAVGVAVAVLGIVELVRARTTVMPHAPQRTSALVETGVYARSRNPMYLGLVFVLLGWALWLGRPVALAGLPLFVAWMNRCQIVPEEEALAARFGAAFAAYRARVRRWL